jgi:hypothetical protein
MHNSDQRRTCLGVQSALQVALDAVLWAAAGGQENAAPARRAAARTPVTRFPHRYMSRLGGYAHLVS